ncbi:zinc-ribbon domain-containing protein [Pseudogemmobacter sp. W21_MBD1_M6]|uniref:zinc-ribbon domain-containing protein n=1 Tax=Pseudogemmobacter sp. W21_MBD1_M6 TaxID=3240271 RepID=UPI003F9927D7
MRLICPNCDAQYEVGDGVIPDEGRDVQCSNCGQTWFQRSARMDAELAEELDVSAETKDWAAPDAGASTEIPMEIDYDEDEEPAPTPVAAPPRRALDESVLGVLREEAELETRARRTHTAEPLETQPDLGLEDTDKGVGSGQATTRERMAKMRGIEDDEPVVPTRRDLLPDIEEINSTLRATSDRKGASAAKDADVDAGSRSGFRLGFGLMTMLTAILMGLYAYAPRVIEVVPASEPVMVEFVEKVNVARRWLDQTVQNTVGGINGG